VSPTARLHEHLREAPIAPVPRRDVGDDAIRAAIGRLSPAGEVVGLFETLLARDTSFVLSDFEVYPAVLLRKPRTAGVLGEQEVCVAKTGAGDLWLFHPREGYVRLVLHDEDFDESFRCESFDAFLEEVLWQALDALDADALDDAGAIEKAKIRCAIDIAGEEALNDDVREKLVAIGLLDDSAP
jgi:hypothetical protein